MGCGWNGCRPGFRIASLTKAVNGSESNLSFDRVTFEIIDTKPRAATGWSVGSTTGLAFLSASKSSNSERHSALGSTSGFNLLRASLRKHYLVPGSVMHGRCPRKPRPVTCCCFTGPHPKCASETSSAWWAPSDTRVPRAHSAHAGVHCPRAGIAPRFPGAKRRKPGSILTIHLAPLYYCAARGTECGQLVGADGDGDFARHGGPLWFRYPFRPDGGFGAVGSVP